MITLLTDSICLEWPVTLWYKTTLSVYEIKKFSIVGFTFSDIGKLDKLNN